MTDLTHLSRREQELRAVLTNTRAIIWDAEVSVTDGWDAFDPRGDFTRIPWVWKMLISDEQAAQVVLPLDVPAGRTYASIWRASKHPEDFRHMDEKAAVAFKERRSSYAQEFRCVDRNGQLHWLFEDASVREHGPDCWHVFAVVTDITERKKVEEALRIEVAERQRAELQLQQQNALLEEAVRSEREAHQKLKQAQSQLIQSEKLAGLGQMVAGIAHEINNPLAFVDNNVAVLQRDSSGMQALLEFYVRANPLIAAHEPQLAAQIDELSTELDLDYVLRNFKELLQRSRDGLKRIKQIVSDLRNFARLDESDLSEVDLNAGVESTLNVIRFKAKTRNIKLDLRLSPLPLVNCYPASINQVIMNLVANAIDACEPEGVVTITTEHADDAVRIIISDTGRGIDPAIRERIFDPFFTTKPVGHGTGLGLSISYGIVRDHGGRIDVDSQPGKGSRFVVCLPLSARLGTPSAVECVR